MKTYKIAPFLLFCLFISAIQPLSAQVTIGTNEAPASGALLQLKQTEGVLNGGQNASKGLKLPRVELEALDQLKMGTSEIPNVDNNYHQHTGLLVFSVTDNAFLCPGLYAWNGEMWTRLGVSCANSVNLNIQADITQFNFISGQNGSVIAPQTMNVEWGPITSLVEWNNNATPAYNSPIQLTAATSITPFPWVSPQAVVLMPDAMTANEVDPTKTGGNPFKTKESILTVSSSKYGESVAEYITINQTNKAITIDGQLQVPMITDPALSTVTHTLKSNAKWTLSGMEPVGIINAFSDLKLNSNSLTVGQAINWEQNNDHGQGAANNLSYTVTGGASKSRFSKLVFSDAELPKRFNDITLSMYQCGTVGNYPTMSDWASLAGFPSAKEPEENPTAQDDLAGKINTPHPMTGIAWHRDQDGNIFLSSSFDPLDITGNSQRWMITNLAAQKYDPIRTDVSSVGKRIPAFINSYLGFDSYSPPHWAYPNKTNATNAGDNSEYKRNPRIGLLYNWDAATFSTVGNIEHLSTPNEDPQKEHVQGVCPSGWHLPSDWEWTQLEKEINTNTMTYSSATANANGNIATGALLARGLKNTDAGYENSHGNAMKDACSEFSEAKTKGLSNPISITSRPGLEITLNGEAYSGEMNAVGTRGLYWAIGHDGTRNGYARRFESDAPSVTRYMYIVGGHSSVRCKKDTK